MGNEIFSEDIQNVKMSCFLHFSFFTAVIIDVTGGLS